jgi:flavin-binding protein dodecin
VGNVVNVIELVADSEEGWVQAVQNAVREAARTVRHITGVEVTNLTAVVEDGRIKSYRANVHLAFAVEPAAERLQAAGARRADGV